MRVRTIVLGLVAALLVVMPAAATGSDVQSAEKKPAEKTAEKTPAETEPAERAAPDAAKTDGQDCRPPARSATAVNTLEDLFRYQGSLEAALEKRSEEDGAVAEASAEPAIEWREKKTQAK
ncbi:MAG: hypothetical protein GY716_07595 [bacterium]|nr:hypothetical protein [bacterium]